MKKIIYILVAATMAVVACQKQSVEPMYSIEDTGHGTYIFTIKAVNDAAGPAVKSDYSADGKFSWSAGDAISVLFHKGSENKFFTLTTTGTGKSATFSGEITSGYEIGASDGDSSDKKVWALFPASANHTYAAGSNPNFYVQPEVDFSATHFSANIPMYALATDVASGLSFANLASTYKFILENIDASVSKVRFDISNQTTYGLSGSWPIHADKYINYDWASPGSANSCLSYTGNVTASKAVFYVSCRYWGTFQPIVKIYNAANGSMIKTVTASAAQKPTSMSSVQPITIDLSDGEYFTPAVTIDGNFADWDGITEYAGTRANGGDNTRINHWRMTSDAQNVYIYAEIVSEKITNARYFYVGFDTAEGGTTHGNIAGLEEYVVIYPAVADSSPVTFIQGVDPRSTVNGSSDGSLTSWGVSAGAVTYFEMCIPRSKVSLTSAGTIKVGISYDNYDTVLQSLTLE